MRIIEVIEYDKNWKLLFEEERSLIKNILGNVVEKVHHIGSTSVEGLAAKPVIDIIVETNDLNELDKCNDKMNSIGYEALGEYGIARRRYFRKGDEQRTHHIHAFKIGDEHVFRHIAFRDYLRAHKNIAREYGDLKKRNVEICNNDIEKYCDLKDDFIKKYELEAIQWMKSNNY